jgi:hypothetical protein
MCPLLQLDCWVRHVIASLIVFAPIWIPALWYNRCWRAGFMDVMDEGFRYDIHDGGFWGFVGFALGVVTIGLLWIAIIGSIGAGGFFLYRFLVHGC